MVIKFFTTILVSFIFIVCSGLNNQPDGGWDSVPQILEKIKAPVFKNQEFNILEFGAIGDGKTLNTEAFKSAILKCNKSGGGRVIVPEGSFLTGAIHLKSNVNLHILKNGQILFSTNVDDYLPLVLTRFEGVECMNYSPFIYAYNQENIAITGSGTIDGNASIENWWVWKGRKEYGWEKGKPSGVENTNQLYKMGEDNIPVKDRVFGKGYYIRPNFVQLYSCKNILIDSITIKRSPMWIIHPVLSENITIQNIKIKSHGPNNDGCNPESSRNILIKNCYFDTGDDCIAIKSGRNGDGRRINVPSENIIVQDCVMKDGHGGVVIGSEMSGSVKNVFIENCFMDSPNLERALRIKTNSLRGGIVENIYMRNSQVGEVRDAVIKVNFMYGGGDIGEHTPITRNIFIDNITSSKSNYAIYLDGYERSPITNLQIKNSSFSGVNKENKLNNYKDLLLNNVFINGKQQN